MKTSRVIERIDDRGQDCRATTWDSTDARSSYGWDIAADSNGHVIELGVFSEPITLGEQTLTPMTVSAIYTRQA